MKNNTHVYTLSSLLALASIVGCGADFDEFDAADQQDLRPEVPICGNCKADIAGGGATDILTMEINSQYKGSIASAVFVMIDSNSRKTTMTLDSTVIDDLNDTNIDEVYVDFDGPDTVEATLDFQLVTGGGQSNPVTINWL